MTQQGWLPLHAHLSRPLSLWSLRLHLFSWRSSKQSSRLYSRCLWFCTRMKGTLSFLYFLSRSKICLGFWSQLCIRMVFKERFTMAASSFPFSELWLTAGSLSPHRSRQLSIAVDFRWRREQRACFPCFPCFPCLHCFAPQTFLLLILALYNKDSCGAGVWTRGLTRAKGALCHWVACSAPWCWGFKVPLQRWVL